MTTRRDDNNLETMIGEPLLSRWIARSQVLLNSYRKVAGSEFLDRSGDPFVEARHLFALPAVVLSHGTEDDPILNYGNRSALSLWEMTPDAFMAMPSRLTAEPGARAAREKALDDTRRQGFSTGYEGIRVSATGRRFYIHDATIWNLWTQTATPPARPQLFPAGRQWPAIEQARQSGARSGAAEAQPVPASLIKIKRAGTRVD